MMRYFYDGLHIEKGCKYWYLNDQLHREDGPALESDNGYRSWYIYGVKYEPEEHPFNIFKNEYNLPEEYKEWPTDMKALFKLIYGGK